jgi:hypothetical protein
MKTLGDYLHEFKAVADQWFAKCDFIGTHYAFFQDFFRTTTSKRAIGVTFKKWVTTYIRSTAWR